jgi:phosphatidylglycerophosphate synthase
VLSGALLWWSPGWSAFIAAAVCVQLRLLCNLLDGMVAIEGGKSTATGALFNEIPDRLADPLFLVPLGYASGYPWLGWLAALLAVLTAYIRVLGGALGLPQDLGVFAKAAANGGSDGRSSDPINRRRPMGQPGESSGRGDHRRRRKPRDLHQSYDRHR